MWPGMRSQGLQIPAGFVSWEGPDVALQGWKIGRRQIPDSFFSGNLALPVLESRLWCKSRNLQFGWEQAEIKLSVIGIQGSVRECSRDIPSISLDFPWGWILGKSPGHRAGGVGSAFPEYPSIVPGWTGHPWIS